MKISLKKKRKDFTDIMKHKTFIAIFIIWAVVLIAIAFKPENKTEVSANYKQATDKSETVSVVELVEEPETTNEITEENEKNEESGEIRYYDIPLDYPMQDMVKMCCNIWELDPALVYAVIQVESGFNPDAYNNGNYGYMQINQICFDQYCVENPFSATENISVGIRILGNYYKKYGSEEMALMAYNLGEGGASKMWNQGIYSIGYVEKVLAVKSQLIGG